MKHSEIKKIEKGEPHNVSGQLNIYVLDTESHITGYGRHNRLTIGTPVEDRSLVMVREDKIGLPESTNEDRIKVASVKSHRLHPRGSRLELIETEEDEKNIWHTYKIVYAANS